jgi:hypothetical protein
MNPYQSVSWHAFRDEVIRRDGGVCVRCGRGQSADVVLQVHHKHYVAGRLPWQYPHDACETLCKGCHAAEHGIVAPKHGWDFIGYEDLGEVVGNCDLCGTAIRYVFVVHHPHWPAMEVGEVCCDHLTSTQIATNHMESMRRFRDRQQRFVSSSRWEVASHGAHSIKQKGFAIQVESRPDGGYRLRVNGRLGKKRFLCVEDAKKMVFEIIESGTAKKYFDRHN